MSMNEYLAQFYKTAGAGQQPQTEKAQESVEKVATAELFAKLAAKNNIDLSAMAPEQVGELFAQVFPEEAQKLAGDMPFPFPPKKDEGKKHESGESAKEEAKEESKKDDDEKKAAAASYFLEKKAFQEKFAEADLMGRVMAHAFTQELQAIKTAQAASATSGEKTAEFPPKKDDEKKDDKKDGKDKESSAKPPVPPAPALQKTAGQKAFDEMAGEYAVKLAADHGHPVEQVQPRITAVLTLGMPESEKTAQVKTLDEGIHVRALEMLERAGYEVNWEEVFGKS